MIRQNDYGLSPRFEIAIDNAEVDYQALNEIEVHLEENMHDMAVLHMAGLPTRASVDYRNKAMRLHLDTGTSYADTFVGYVIDVRPEAKTSAGLLNNSPFQDVQIVCLGASYDMRGARSTIWTGYRLQDVAQTFAERYGYSLDVPADPLIKSPIMQKEESDWKFLVRYATMLGYSVTLHGTHLSIFDPFKAVSRGISFNKLFTAKNIGAQIGAAPGQITNLKASLAERHADGSYKDTVVTVQQADGLAYDVSSSEIRGLDAPARFQDRIADNVTNYEEAVRAIHTRSKADYDFYAKTDVLGVAGCKPGGVVEVDSYGSEIDGLWYVQSVKHDLTSGVFTSSLAMAKNINSELTFSSVQPFQAPSEPVLRNGVWTATKKTINVY